MRDSVKKKKQRKSDYPGGKEEAGINRKDKKNIETERARWTASHYQIISLLSAQMLLLISLLSKASVPLPLLPYNTIFQHRTVTVRASVMHDIHSPRLAF